jgi:hypothetical protein
MSAYHPRNPNRSNSYATKDDFQQLFTTEATDLFRLSLQLTADAEKAEGCLILAMKYCFGTNTIFKDFARVWARRMVIRSAIQLAFDVDHNSANDAETEFHLHSKGIHNDHQQLESMVVLHLSRFDRLAFVICVFERLSISDCALLLRKSRKDVNEAIVRAANRSGKIPEL